MGMFHYDASEQASVLNMGRSQGADGTSSETLAERAYALADRIEEQADRLERSFARIIHGESCGSSDEGVAEKPSQGLPNSLARITMASHRIDKMIEAFAEVA